MCGPQVCGSTQRHDAFFELLGCEVERLGARTKLEGRVFKEMLSEDDRPGSFSQACYYKCEAREASRFGSSAWY